MLDTFIKVSFIHLICVKISHMAGPVPNTEDTTMTKTEIVSTCNGAFP